MGTWGVGIFSDDLAADIRNEFRDLIGEGHSAESATQILEKTYRSSIKDRDEGPVFWIALAMTQHKLGRLEERVKQKALDAIDSGAGLALWRDDPTLLKKRQAVLVRARATLLAPQKSPTKVAKPFRNANKWPVGRIVAYRKLSGQFIAFRVIGHHEDQGGRFAIVEILDWSGPNLPEKADLKRVGIRKGIGYGENTQMMLGGNSPREFPEDRVHHLPFKLRRSQKPDGFMVMLWRKMDEWLEEYFGIT